MLCFINAIVQTLSFIAYLYFKLRLVKVQFFLPHDVNRKAKRVLMFPEKTQIPSVDKDRRGGCGNDTGGAEGGGSERGGGRNRGDESRWKGRKHEAGMTSLGLTFHSRPTPALCILTSLRCVLAIFCI